MTDSIEHRTILRTNGTTTCCDARTSHLPDSDVEYCLGCHQTVQMRIVDVPSEREIQVMIAGATPCGIPRKKRRKPPKRK